MSQYYFFNRLQGILLFEWWENFILKDFDYEETCQLIDLVKDFMINNFLFLMIIGWNLRYSLQQAMQNYITWMISSILNIISMKKKFWTPVHEPMSRKQE